MAKQLKEFLESFDFNRAALAKQRLQNLRHLGRHKVRGARIANLMRAAGLKEEEMDEQDLDQLDEVLSADAKAEDWIHDFVHSTDPRFEGKTKKERIRMALGAYYHKARHKDGEGLGEAFVNGREYASHGLIHPDHAKMHKVGNTTDFYAHGTGDKISGTVTKNDGKSVTFKADKLSGGKSHSFKVSSNLPKLNEEAGMSSLLSKILEAAKKKAEKKEDLPFEPDAPKKKPDAIAGKYGQGYSTARHLARLGMKQAMKEEYGVEIDDEVADQILEAAKQYAGLEKEDKKGLPTALIKKSQKAVEGDTVEGWDHPHQAVKKESYDEEGNLITMAKTFQEFMEGMTATKVAPNVTRYTGGSYGNAKGARYGNTDYDKETLDTKDDEGEEQQKRGRGRPAGSKSGARGPRIK